MHANIHYRIDSSSAFGHVFQVQLRIKQPDPSGQVLRLPLWIPGSYLIRDFARHIMHFEAKAADGKRVAYERLDKTSWQLEPVEGELFCEYTVYAYDTSVRTAYLDQARGFFNGTSLCLEVVGQSDQPHSVELLKPEAEFAKNWQVATTLPAMQVDDQGFGLYQTKNYLSLIDFPVEMAEMERAQFVVDGKPHEIVFTGIKGVDVERIAKDLTPICQWHCDLFGGFPADKYLFITRVEHGGYGGLEHMDSTMLLCSPEDLALIGESMNSTELKDSYINFLGLCSHEYFHLWNVKRMRPSAFIPYDLSRANYTDALWFFEGMTSYYDDLSLVKTGTISVNKYLDLLAKNISRVNRTLAQEKQSVTESSFEAWSKFYQQDENAPNAVVSYYAKGAMIALMLDLSIRKATGSQSSLDDVMQTMWQRYLNGDAVDTGDVIEAVNNIAGPEVADRLSRALFQAERLEIDDLVSVVGLAMKARGAVSFSDKGGRTPLPAMPVQLGVDLYEEAGKVKIRFCYEGEAAMEAGLSAGDE
ncbi:MAG: peptidase M61, partial [Pseudomonadota bacterium]|nr:peptidase M61 [Pseudomonadota bacterium]